MTNGKELEESLVRLGKSLPTAAPLADSVLREIERRSVTPVRHLRWARFAALAATTAALLIVLAIGWLVLVAGNGVSVAFADVVKALNNVNSATWRMTWAGKESQVSQIGMFLAPSHERLETNKQGEKLVEISDSDKGKEIVLDPATKTATIINLASLPPNDPSGRVFEHLRELIANAQSGRAGKVERLGTETIDGRPAEGFRIQLGSGHAKLWADVKTLLPVRVEVGDTANPDRLVMTDFQINPNLDKSLFSLDVPPDYTVHTMQIDPSKTFWVGLTDALKMAADYNGGVFPPTLRGEQGIDGILERARKTSAEKYRKDSPEALKLSADISTKLRGAFAVLDALPPDAWHYAGKDVRLGTVNQPILWVKQRNGTHYEVIYADLSIKELPPQDVSKLPQRDTVPKP